MIKIPLLKSINNVESVKLLIKYASKNNIVLEIEKAISNSYNDEVVKLLIKYTIDNDIDSDYI